MSEQIREQISAFLDGELPGSETELLLKRLMRDGELRESFGRYALIGESLRGATHAHLTKGFSARVNRAIDGETSVAVPIAPRRMTPRWWRPLAGAAVAAGVAAVAVVALQQRAVAPGIAVPGAARIAVRDNGSLQGSVASLTSPARLTAFTAAPPAGSTGQSSGEPISYTTPVVSGPVAGALPAARLTNYVFAHSKYSSPLGQSNVLSGLLTDADEQEAAAVGAADTRIAP